MRYTIDLEKKEVIIFGYDKKYKKYLDILENVYKKKDFKFNHFQYDLNETTVIGTISQTISHVSGTGGGSYTNSEILMSDDTTNATVGYITY